MTTAMMRGATDAEHMTLAPCRGPNRRDVALRRISSLKSSDTEMSANTLKKGRVCPE